MIVPLFALLLCGAPRLAVAPQDTSAVRAPAPPGDTARRRSKGHYLMLSAPTIKPEKGPAPAALLADAYADAGTRALVVRARAARLEQDTTLLRYDARGLERGSIYLKLGRFAPRRLLIREETSARVRWERGVGARVDLTGSRESAPLLGDQRVAKPFQMGFSGLVPYFPGREALWFGSDVVSADPRAGDPLIHPLVNGAERYYRYARGDSMSFRLANGRSVRLVELRVQPRLSRWNLVVASLWFDQASARLVRAAYHLAVPLAVNSVKTDVRALGLLTRALLPPVRAEMRGVTIEYGLHDLRFWLPSSQVAEGELQVGSVRLPMEISQTFRYASVNGSEKLPPLPGASSAPANPDEELPDSVEAPTPRVAADSAEARRLARLAARKARDARRKAQCAAGDHSESVVRAFRGSLPLLMTAPCDTLSLISSPTLPATPFTDADSLLDQRGRAELLGGLAAVARAPFAPGPLTLDWGLTGGLMRYNRVEGLSPGVRLSEELGAGLSLSASARIGFAELAPRGELSLARATANGSLGVGAYRRLGVANAWAGSPSSGLGPTLLNGQDEGEYYDAAGVELVRSLGSGPVLDLRAFAERQSPLRRHTTFSVANLLGAEPLRENIVAERGTVAGAEAHLGMALGEDPARTRLLLDARAQAVGGDFRFGRGTLEARLTQPLPGALQLSFDASGGSSLGRVPPQALYYLGGMRTVRGVAPATAVGDSFWLLRTDLEFGRGAIRPGLFADVGWAGDRARWGAPVRPSASVGVALSLFDGMLRAGIARTLRPRGWGREAAVDTRY